MQMPESGQGQLWKALEDHQQLVRQVRLGCQDLRKIRFAVAEQRSRKAQDGASWQPKGTASTSDLVELEHKLVAVMTDLREALPTRDEELQALQEGEVKAAGEAESIHAQASSMPPLEDLLLAAAEASRAGFDSCRSAEEAPTMALLGEEVAVALEDEDYELIFHDRELGIVLKMLDGGLPKVNKCERPLPRLGDVAFAVNGIDLRGHPEPLKRILAVARSPRRPISLRFAPPSFLERPGMRTVDDMEQGHTLLEGPVRLVSAQGSQPTLSSEKFWARLRVGQLPKYKDKQVWMRLYSTRNPGSKIVTTQIITDSIAHSRDLEERHQYILCLVHHGNISGTGSLKPFTVSFDSPDERDAWLQGIQVSVFGWR